MADQRDYENRIALNHKLVAVYDEQGCDEVEISVADTIGHISDSYHTFDELYAHRIELWIKLCVKTHSLSQMNFQRSPVWRSDKHSDGSKLEGWFVLGMGYDPGAQITYHVPNDRWFDCDFAEALDRAPEFDGHTSVDVLERLKKL